MIKKGFADLLVWQRAKTLAVKIYEITKNGKFNHDFSLQDQMRRSSISIPSNIAEGDTLNSKKQSCHFFLIAKASCAELLTQAVIAHEIGYIETNSYKEIETECNAIAGMLTNLIKSRNLFNQ